MTPYFTDPYATLYCGDVLEVLSHIPPESVHTVCTSPPYWGLRVYEGNQERIWVDGWRGGYGLEPTLELYIAHSVEILRAIRRVLRDDGTVWWNIDDSYAGSPAGNKAIDKFPFDDGKPRGRYQLENYERNQPKQYGKIIKPKDLCLIPFRLAIALQEDGWWVRSVIIWHKPNPMPESVSGFRWERCRVKVKDNPHELDVQRIAKDVNRTTAGLNSRNDRVPLDIWKDCPGCAKCSPNDGLVLRKGSWRPTDAHEYVLMLAKSESYYGDAEAVRIPYSPLTTWEPYQPKTQKDIVWRTGVGGQGGPGDVKARIRELGPRNGANLRSVWSFSTEPFPGAHFAVFPSKLPETCILAGTSEYGVCAKCGSPWARITERQTIDTRPGRNVGTGKSGQNDDPNQALHQSELSKYRQEIGYETLGWRPSCKCRTTERVPATVLDPFSGSGTTLMVAKSFGRKSIGIDISADYCKMAQKRVEAVVMPLSLWAEGEWV